MVQAIRQEMTVEKENTLEIRSPILKQGAHVEVIVLVGVDAAHNERSLSALLGKGKGSFKSAEEADAFIRNERDMWQ